MTNDIDHDVQLYFKGDESVLQAMSWRLKMYLMLEGNTTPKSDDPLKERIAQELHQCIVSMSKKGTQLELPFVVHEPPVMELS